MRGGSLLQATYLVWGPAQAWQICNLSATTHGGLDNSSSSLHIGTGTESERGHHSYQSLTLGGVQHRHGRFVIFLQQPMEVLVMVLLHFILELGNSQ